jgi:hypothetical protein
MLCYMFMLDLTLGVVGSIVFSMYLVYDLSMTRTEYAEDNRLVRCREPQHLPRHRESFPQISARPPLLAADLQKENEDED